MHNDRSCAESNELEVEVAFELPYVSDTTLPAAAGIGKNIAKKLTKWRTQLTSDVCGPCNVVMSVSVSS